MPQLNVIISVLGSYFGQLPFREGLMGWDGADGAPPPPDPPRCERLCAEMHPPPQLLHRPSAVGMTVAGSRRQGRKIRTRRREMMTGGVRRTASGRRSWTRRRANEGRADRRQGAVVVQEICWV